MLLSDAVKTGGRRALLEGLRDVLVAAIDAEPSQRDLPSLVLRLETVSAALHELETEEAGANRSGGKESVADALAARREAKQAASG